MAVNVAAKALGTAGKWTMAVIVYPLSPLMDYAAKCGSMFAGKKGLARSELGFVNMAGVIMLGIGMVFIAVGFIIYPITIDGVDAITAWTAADNVSITVTTFTGLSPVAGITPLIVLIGFISSAVITGFMGVKTIKGGGSGGKIDAGGLIMQGIGMIFISVGLIIFPVVMDGVRAAQVDIAASTGTFTGLTQILSVTPLIVLVAFISAAVITTYFGAKKTLA